MLFRFIFFFLQTSATPHLQVSCKMLTLLNQYTTISNSFWMLCEGIYLHTLIIVAVFVGEQQLFWYYVLGWGELWSCACTLGDIRGDLKDSEWQESGLLQFFFMLFQHFSQTQDTVAAIRIQHVSLGLIM